MPDREAKTGEKTATHLLEVHNILVHGAQEVVVVEVLDVHVAAVVSGDPEVRLRENQDKSTRDV